MVGGHLALSLHSSNEPGELSQSPRYDDSTINVVVSISTLVWFVRRGWWRWALVSPDGVVPSWMVDVSASVNLPLHHKV